MFKESKKVFNLILCSLKYLFNPITAIFVQSKNGNIRLIHSWTFLFNPLKNTFNPPVIFPEAFHLIFLRRARPKDQPTRRRGVRTHNYGGLWWFWFFQKQELSYKELKSKTRYLKSSIKPPPPSQISPPSLISPFLRGRHLFSRRVWFYFFWVPWARFMAI